MTEKQIEKIMSRIPRCVPGKKAIYTAEEKQLQEELCCRRMINSILCYNGERNLLSNSYMKSYINALGLHIVKRLVEEQLTDFKKATVKINIVTDSEGVSYNSIIWADDD